MNETQSNPDPDVVFSRLLDGRGKAADWQSLRDLTSRDGAAWDRLIGNAGDQDVLGDVVSMAGARAEACDVNDAAPAPLPFQSAQGRRADRAVRAARLGWLVAACMALGLASVSLKTRLDVPPAPSTPVHEAGLVNLNSLTSNDLMTKFKDRAIREGSLVGEMPERLVIETRPSGDGKGYEVLYIRQLIERAVVDDLYKLGTDETGRKVIVPASLPTPKPTGAM